TPRNLRGGQRRPRLPPGRIRSGGGGKVAAPAPAGVPLRFLHLNGVVKRLAAFAFCDGEDEMGGAVPRPVATRRPDRHGVRGDPAEFRCLVTVDKSVAAGDPHVTPRYTKSPRAAGLRGHFWSRR